MALLNKLLNRSCFINQIIKPSRWSINHNCRILASSTAYKISFAESHETKRLDPVWINLRSYCTPPKKALEEPPPTEEKKPGLIKRFKQMYRDYWYVLVPVHLVTSAFWVGGLYYFISSGVDVVQMMESFGISEKIITHLRDTGAGNFALTFACYKVISPLRYAVTVGGTTLAINKLTALGWIKPVPSREKLKEMYQVKKENFQDKMQEMRYTRAKKPNSKPH